MSDQPAPAGVPQTMIRHAGQRPDQVSCRRVFFFGIRMSPSGSLTLCWTLSSYAWRIVVSWFDTPGVGLVALTTLGQPIQAWRGSRLAITMPPLPDSQLRGEQGGMSATSATSIIGFKEQRAQIPQRPEPPQCPNVATATTDALKMLRCQ